MAHVQSGIAMAVDAFSDVIHGVSLIISKSALQTKRETALLCSCCLRFVTRAGPIEKEMRGDIAGRYSLINKS
jgi:hypothetical protein